jgi:hypothetical protein
MPSNSSPISIPSYRKVLLDEIEKSWEILTFDFSEFELKPFFWYALQCCIGYRTGLKLKLEGRPVDGGIRVPPDHWLDYRKKRKFRGPNCLCPLLRTADKEPSLTEAQIVLKESGDHIGEYIAECPNGRCEYFGQLPVARPVFPNK